MGSRRRQAWQMTTNTGWWLAVLSVVRHSLSQQAVVRAAPTRAYRTPT